MDRQGLMKVRSLAVRLRSASFYAQTKPPMRTPSRHLLSFLPSLIGHGLRVNLFPIDNDRAHR